MIIRLPSHMQMPSSVAEAEDWDTTVVVDPEIRQIVSY